MPNTLRVLLITMSVLSLLYIVWRIRHSKMQIEYALFWIILSLLFIVMSVFPELVYWVTNLMGMMSPANLVYLFIIAVLLLKVFMVTIELSALENKVKDLTQQLAISQKEQMEINKRLEKK